MGCDFYVFYKVCIEYKKGEKTVVEEHRLDDTRERCDWWECERNEDFEELIDYHERAAKQRREQIDYELSSFPKLDIFKNRRWLVIDSAQEKYKNIAKKYNISENDIVKIWKEGDFMLR